MNRLSVACLLLGACLATACSTPSPVDAEPSAARKADLEAAAALAAQAPADDGALGPWLATERARIAAERNAADARFASDEKACWQRFAVNACVRSARVQRRSVTDGLREQDLALNQVERQRNTAARLQALDDKARAQAQKLESQQNAPANGRAMGPGDPQKP